MIKRKKSQQHIEMIIAFVIFITFISFLFVFFNPFKKTVSSDFANTVFLNLENKMKTNILTVSVNVKDVKDINGAGGCIIIDKIDGFDCNGKKILVKDKDDDIKNAKIDTNTISFDVTTDLTFYSLYCENDLNQKTNLGKCANLPNIKYSKGIVVERNLWSETKLKQLKTDYETDYETVKTNYVPGNNNFKFAIDVDGSNKITADKEVPKGVNVYSFTMPIDIVDENANFKKGRINIIVW